MTVRAALTIPLLIAISGVAAPAPTSPRGREQLIPTHVGRLTGETVVHAEGGARIGRLEASVEFSASTRTGTVQFQFAPSNGATSLAATAQVSAGSPQEGFGAVSALVAAIAGRPTGTSLRLSQMRVEGDVAAVRTHADRITAWWDAQGEMNVDGYQSPVLSIGQAARLQINAWGKDTEPTHGPRELRGYAILLFDPIDPTHIISGRIVSRVEQLVGHPTFLDIPFPSPFTTHATLTPITQTAHPNDFLLCIGQGQLNADCSDQFGPRVRAELAIDVLDDGTIDVRGVADLWMGLEGVFTIEGTANARFDPPGQ
jgi:hypothetical protein